MSSKLTDPIEFDQLIHHRVAFTMDESHTIHNNGAVAVDQCRIVGVGPAVRTTERYAGKETIRVTLADPERVTWLLDRMAKCTTGRATPTGVYKATS